MKPRVRFKDREIVKRWNAESEEFFIKLQNTGIKLSVLGTILSFFPPTTAIGLTILGVGSSMATVSKLTVKNTSKEELEKLKVELELLKAKLN